MHIILHAYTYKYAYSENVSVQNISQILPYDRMIRSSTVVYDFLTVGTNAAKLPRIFDRLLD